MLKVFLLNGTKPELFLTLAFLFNGFPLIR